MILSNATAALVRRDMANYVELIQAKGGTLTAADQQLIRQFVTMLYGTVGRQDFITLRSSQNMGSGSTAYSFHGRPCTLVNGPTWGANGITFAGVGVGDRIDTPIPNPGVNQTMLSVFSQAGDGAAYETVLEYGSFRVALFEDIASWYFGIGVPGANTSVATQPATPGAMTWIASDIVAANIKTYLNGQSPVTASQYSITDSTGGTLSLGSHGGAGRLSGTIGLAMVGPFNVGDSVHLALYNAYKATIGQGLGLP